MGKNWTMRLTRHAPTSYCVEDAPKEHTTSRSNIVIVAINEMSMLHSKHKINKKSENQKLD